LRVVNELVGYSVRAERSERGAINLVVGEPKEDRLDGLIYLIGLIVVVMAILSFFGLR
jgi:hypothetical protein